MQYPPADWAGISGYIEFKDLVDSLEVVNYLAE
jgi:hypothetical protein